MRHECRLKTAFHALVWCSSCGKDDVYDQPTKGQIFFRRCSECDAVRAINVASVQFHETIGDIYVYANLRTPEMGIVNPLIPRFSREARRGSYFFCAPKHHVFNLAFQNFRRFPKQCGYTKKRICKHCLGSTRRYHLRLHISLGGPSG